MTVAVAVVVTVASLLLPAPALVVQLLVLAPLVAVFGLPHGAYDAAIAEDLFRPRFGRVWPLPFAGGYLGLAAAVVLLWWAVPPAALVLFLAYSAVHFGLEDTEGEATATWPEVLARGAVPIAVPAVLHAADVAAVFDWLLPSTMPVSVPLVRFVAVPVAAVAAGLLVRRWRTVGPLVLVLLVAPPLVGFAVYFCLWHSVRHASTLAADIDANRPHHAWTAFARRAAPATILSAVAATALAVWLARSAGIGPAAARGIFVTLAALTVPHMALDATAARHRLTVAGG